MAIKNRIPKNIERIDKNQNPINLYLSDKVSIKELKNWLNNQMKLDNNFIEIDQDNFHTKLKALKLK